MDIEIALLGLIQGFTEFLPVSSSGHLALAQILFGTDLPPLSYDIVLHVATALATVIFFFGDICELLTEWVKGFGGADYRRSSGWLIGWATIIGTAVTGVTGILLKDIAEAAMSNSLLVGLGLTCTGVLLVLSRFVRTGLAKVYVRDGLFVGLAQGIAVMPGISRSGLTILTGQALGLDKREMFRFSFILSIPAICGATLLQALDVGGWNAFIGSLPRGWYFGAGLAFVSGFAALALLKRLVITSKWWFFGIYCLFIGLSAVTLSFLGMW